jgi:hypothetical protein
LDRLVNEGRRRKVGWLRKIRDLVRRHAGESRERGCVGEIVAIEMNGLRVRDR